MLLLLVLILSAEWTCKIRGQFCSSEGWYSATLVKHVFSILVVISVREDGKVFSQSTQTLSSLFDMYERVLSAVTVFDIEH